MNIHRWSILDIQGLQLGTQHHFSVVEVSLW